MDDIIRADSLKVEKPVRAFFQSQLYFLKLIYKKHPIIFIVFILLTLFSSIIPPIIVVLNKETIDAISMLTSEDTLDWVILLLVITFTLNFVSSFLKELEEYIFKKIMYTVNYVLKSVLSSKFMRLSLERFEDSTFHDKIKLAELSLNGSGVRVIQSLVSVFGVLISLVGILGVLFTLHWSLPLALFVSTLPGITLMFFVKIKSYRMERDISSHEREMYFTDGLFTTKSALKEIKVYNTKHYLINKWKQSFEKMVQIKMSVALWDLKYKSISLTVLQGTHLAISIFLVYQVVGSHLSIGSYVALITATTMVQGLFGQIGMKMSSIFETAIYNNSLLSIINDADSDEDKDSQHHHVQSIEQIELKHAYFAYPNSNADVLKDVSLNIKKGDRISIVGSNGSGKTTLAYCLLGLYQLNKGEFIVNDNYFKDVNKESFYQHIAVVFQDFIRYKYSVRENIALGNLKYLNRDDELQQVLDRIELKNKVLQYPNQLETPLSKEFHSGTELSGGEWQRMALGRAFIKHADLVLLDEPTAALDPISELSIFEMFHKLYSEKTTISISHRIGPTRLSNLIIVMDEGRIVEKGTFDELIALKGYFYNMYEAQSTWYKEKPVTYQYG